MTITHYDIYDNHEGENIIKRRPWRCVTTDVEALRERMRNRLTRMIRRPDGKRYKELTVLFCHQER